jgi:hypothetical protein
MIEVGKRTRIAFPSGDLQCAGYLDAPGEAQTKLFSIRYVICQHSMLRAPATGAVNRESKCRCRFRHLALNRRDLVDAGFARLDS